MGTHRSTMASCSRTSLVVVFAALVGLWHLGRPAFLPPAGQSARRAVPVAGAVAALTGAMPALADKIDDAAVKLSERILLERRCLHGDAPRRQPVCSPQSHKADSR